jgi:hypothetical protein
MGCHPESAWLVSPPAVEHSVSQRGALPKVDITSKAEVLIVIQNAGLMKPNIEQVRNSLDGFVREFTNNNPLQFHFGVLPVFDNKTFNSKEWICRCGDDDAANGPIACDASGAPSANGSEHRKQLRNGLLRAIRLDEEHLAPGNKYFVSSDDPDRIQKMMATMTIPIAQPFGYPHPASSKDQRPFAVKLAEARSQGRTSNEVDGCGPNDESVFTPIESFYTVGRSYPESQGFFFDKNSFTFIIFVTNGDDESTVTSSQLIQLLINAKGGDATKVAAFAAIIPADASGPTCQKDESERLANGKVVGAPKILNFINELGLSGKNDSVSANMCDPNFGVQLAAWGKRLRSKTFDHVIQLTDTPVAGTLHVYYGAKNNSQDFEIPAGPGGYYFNPEENTIRLGDDLKITPVAGGVVHVEYLPITDHDRHHNLVRPAGV